ncbi:carbohydrate kinase [Streptosporangium sp. NPDC049644]|uniref:carbohydrate kinase family protein n=1 Tax=Streptosporangium sp. NPDC049644 TaxID=3155507 RepID=UPI00342BCD46
MFEDSCGPSRGDGPAMITVIGESVVDMVAEGGGRAYTGHPGGSPLNVAVGLARLGDPAAFVARLSTGVLGRTLRAHAAANGVDLRWAVPASEPATLAIVSVDEAGQAAYDFYVEGTADWQWGDGEPHLPAESRVVHTGSVAAWRPPGGDRIAGAVARARAEGQVLISYDPNIRPALLDDPASARPLIERYVTLAHVVKVSEEDLSWLYPNRPAGEVAREWLGSGPDLVVVTYGGEGCLGLTRGGHALRRPAIPAQVVDTVGAGDAFTAGLLDGLLRGGRATPALIGGLSEAELTGILDQAAWVAGLTCQRAGADPPTRAELQAAQEPGHSVPPGQRHRR